MKKKGKKRLPYLKLSLFLILFLCQTARSATYYVATTGSNSNPGSQLLPWLTIQYAANSVSAGDTVIVLSGIYNERVHLNNPGAPGQKIVYMAKPARTVYMQGFLVVAPYNSIEGFDIATQTSGWQGGGFWVAANYIDLINNSLHDIPGAGIQATWGASSNWSRNVYVAQNYFFHCDEGMDVEGYNWLIEDNEVERPLYAGLAGDYSRFFGDSITFRHNYFHGARISEVGGAHVDGFQYFDNNGEFATNIVIEGNYVESFDEGVILESTNTAGSTANIIIRNNVFIGGESWEEPGVFVPKIIFGMDLKSSITFLQILNSMAWDCRSTVKGLFKTISSLMQGPTIGQMQPLLFRVGTISSIMFLIPFMPIQQILSIEIP